MFGARGGGHGGGRHLSGCATKLPSPKRIVRPCAYRRLNPSPSSSLDFRSAAALSECNRAGFEEKSSKDNPLKRASDSRIVSSGVDDPTAAFISFATSGCKRSEIALANTDARTFSGRGVGDRGRGVCVGGSLASPTACLDDATLACCMVMRARGGRIPGPRLPLTLREEGGISGGGGRLEERPSTDDVGNAAVSSWPTAPPMVVGAATGVSATPTANAAALSANACRCAD